MKHDFKCVFDESNSEKVNNRPEFKKDKNTRQINFCLALKHNFLASSLLFERNRFLKTSLLNCTALRFKNYSYINLKIDQIFFLWFNSNFNFYIYKLNFVFNSSFKLSSQYQNLK